MPDTGPPGSLANSDRQLFESGYLADASVICNGREWKVHKVILASRNEWFRKALCGSFLEATIGIVTLSGEEDPYLIDILLRFIYEKDLDLPELNGSEGLPALCVKLFRVADFYLVDELKASTTEQLRIILEETTKTLGFEPIEGQAPKCVIEALEAVEESYKDNSTKPIQDILTEFVYANMRKILRSTDGNELLDKVPDIAVRLLRSHLRADQDTEARRSGARFGLPILAAVDSSPKLYQIEPMEPDAAETVGMPLLLYPDVKNPRSVFTVVDPETREPADALTWVAPSAPEVNSMATSPGCAVVKVERESLLGGKKWMYIQFENPEDAGIYVERYRKARCGIALMTYEPGTLVRRMKKMIDRNQHDGIVIPDADMPTEDA